MSVTRPGRSTVTTTEARRKFGRLLQRVARGEDIAITRRGAPRAVLVSAERYQRFVRIEATGSISPDVPRQRRRQP